MKAKVITKSVSLRDADGKYVTHLQGSVVEVLREPEYRNLLRDGAIAPLVEEAAAPKK